MDNAERRKQIAKKKIALEFPEEFTKQHEEQKQNEKKKKENWQAQAITDTVMYKISIDKTFLQNAYQNNVVEMKKRAIEMIKADEKTPEAQKQHMIRAILQKDNKDKLLRYIKDSMLYYGKMGVGNYADIITKMIALANSLDEKGLQIEANMLDVTLREIASIRFAGCKDEYMEGEHFKSMTPVDGDGSSNRFNGCVRYQMNCQNKGQDVAEKICGYIKQRKGDNQTLRVTLAQMKNICTKCASEMEQKGLAYADFDYDPELAQALALQGEN